jgi:hypothetical protein
VRASKEVLYKLQFFVELLHGGVLRSRVYGAVPNTPYISLYNIYYFYTTYMHMWNGHVY